MQLNWNECDFCGDLTEVSGSGVYVIWSDDSCIYVGQGSIRSRLQSHKTNPDITLYAGLGTLYATWAVVSSRNRDGVERYLADELEPLEGEQHPDASPIKVNLPRRRHTE